MPGPITSGGVLIDDTSGGPTYIDSSGAWAPSGDVWSENPSGGGNANSGWGGFFGQIAAAGANIGLAYAQRDLQGNGYRYNASPFSFGPGYRAPQYSAQGGFLSSGIGGILLIAVIVLVLIKVLK